MKTRLALTLLGTALLSVPAAFGQAPEATSGIVGFSTLSCPAGTSVVVPTLVNSSVFQGQAAISSDGLTITPTTAPGWTVGAYSKTTFSDGTPNYPKFYAEVVSGVNEGLVLDIDNNSTTSLTMMLPVSPSVLRGTTVQIAIREHVTLNKIVQGATGLSPFSISVNIYNANGSQSTRFFDGTSWVDESFLYSVGHSVIYPGAGIACSASTPAVFNFMGEVKPTKTQVPVYSSATNIVGTMNPASQTTFFNSGLVNPIANFNGGVNSFSTDGTMTTVGTYFSDGTSLLDSSFAPLTNSSPDSIPLNRGVVVSVTSDAVWTVNSPLAP